MSGKKWRGGGVAGGGGSWLPFVDDLTAESPSELWAKQYFCAHLQFSSMHFPQCKALRFVAFQ